MAYRTPEIEENIVDGRDDTNTPSLEGKPHRHGGPTADDLEARSNLGGHELQLPINNATATYSARWHARKMPDAEIPGEASLPSAKAPSPT